jgi:hypothetical protein
MQCTLPAPTTTPHPILSYSLPGNDLHVPWSLTGRTYKYFHPNALELNKPGVSRRTVKARTVSALNANSPTNPRSRAPPKRQCHPMDYDNDDLSPALKSRRPPPPAHTNDSDEDRGDKTPSPKPKHRRPLLDHNNHDDGEDVAPAPKRHQRPHRVPDFDGEKPHHFHANEPGTTSRRGTTTCLCQW